MLRCLRRLGLVWGAHVAVLGSGDVWLGGELPMRWWLEVQGAPRRWDKAGGGS